MNAAGDDAVSGEHSFFASDGLLDALGVGVVVVGHEGRILASNEAAHEIFPALVQTLGQRDRRWDLTREYVDVDGKPMAAEAMPMARSMATGEAVSAVVIGATEPGLPGAGQIIWLLASAQRIARPDGEGFAVITTFVDITAQRRAQEALAASELRFRLLAENAVDAIFRLRIVDDVDAICEYANRAVRSLLGLEVEDVLSDFDRVIRGLHPDDLAMAHETFMMAPFEPHSLLLRFRRPDNRLIWVHCRVVPVVADGVVVAVEGIAHDVTEMKEREADLTHRASHDSLTGLANRGAFLERLEGALNRERRNDGLLGVLYLDLDRFKTVNDSLGHDVGDRVLTAMASRLEETLRPSDRIARLGGDEFAVILPDLAEPDEAVQIASRLLRAVAAPVRIDGAELLVTASIGIAFADGVETTPAEILRDADLAMYQAKDNGRARYECHERVRFVGEDDMAPG